MTDSKGASVSNMLTPRRAYWVLLVLMGLALVAVRTPQIWPGELTPLDQGLLVFVVVLLLLPLVAEAELFGFKLRRQIEGVRQDLTREVQALHQAVVASASVRSDIYNVTGVPLMSAEALERLTEDLQRRPKAPEPMRADEAERVLEATVPPEADLLFRVRYRLEQTLEDVSGLIGLDSRTPTHAVRALETEGYLSRSDVAAFREVWGIASRAIHGEPVEERHVAFVKDAFPLLLATIESVRRVYLDDG